MQEAKARNEVELTKKYAGLDDVKIALAHSEICLELHEEDRLATA